MSHLDDIGERDGWRCWLCDEDVDPHMPSSDPRGASVDMRITKARAKKNKKNKTAQPDERLAHVGCNTGKGANDPVVPWPEDFILVDPTEIIGAGDRLERKGGREIMARCVSEADAHEVADWLVDRMSRLHPQLELRSRIDPGGGQFMVSLST